MCDGAVKKKAAGGLGLALAGRIPRPSVPMDLVNAAIWLDGLDGQAAMTCLQMGAWLDSPRGRAVRAELERAAADLEWELVIVAGDEGWQGHGAPLLASLDHSGLGVAGHLLTQIARWVRAGTSPRLGDAMIASLRPAAGALLEGLVAAAGEAGGV